MPARCDLTNRQFGRLVALNPTDARDRKGSIYWRCRCECGNEIDVSESGLVHGNYRSCGCLRQEYRANIHKQLHMLDGTCVEWLKNRKSRRDSSSGFRGIYHTKSDRYRVTIGFKGKRYQLGTYKEFEEAVEARMEAEHLIHDGFLNAYDRWSERAEEDPQWAEENPLVYDVLKEDGELRVVTNIV